MRLRTTVHIVCPHCGATNNVPGARVGERPNCGRCHRPLFDGTPVSLDAAGLDNYLSRNDTPVLVDFWAPWCGPCRMMAPAFEQAAAELEPGVRLAKVNTEDEQQLGARLGIRSIPTLVLFEHGREIARQAGAMDARGIVGWVNGQL